MSDFNSLTLSVPSEDWIKFESLLAKWFHIQPSEMDKMGVDEFLRWVDEANAQIERQNKAYEGG